MLAAYAPEASAVGFDGYLLPPASKALGGAGAGCDGYGVFAPRDLGNMPQMGSTPTRYGSKDALLRLVAVAKANGLSTYLDVVLHQLMGENGGPGVFRYLGADRKRLNGRGATTPGWFRGDTGNRDPVPPFCPEDAVPNVFYDYPFGREKSYQNCRPHRVTIEDALDYGDWLFRTTDAHGGRFDDVKGTWAPFVAEFMNSRVMAHKDWFSEYFEGNPATLDWWARTPPMSDRSAVADFTVHWALREACNNSNAYALDGAGYHTWNPHLACVFTDNPDTDTSDGQQIIQSKLLAYAYLATVPSRMMLVYGKDYFPSSVWPGAYGLKPHIDNLLWIKRHLPFGPMVTRHVDGKVIVLERTGKPGLLTAINFDDWNRRTITVQTAFGPNRRLHSYCGRHDDIWTDGQGLATFTIPSNAYHNGQSYLCWSVAGIEGKNTLPEQRTTNTLFMADDLDIPAARNGTMHLGKICVAKDSAIVSRAFTYERIPGATIKTFFVNEFGKPVVGYAPADGDYDVVAVCEGMPDEGAKAEIEVSYMAPKRPLID